MEKWKDVKKGIKSLSDVEKKNLEILAKLEIDEEIELAKTYGESVKKTEKGETIPYEIENVEELVRLLDKERNAINYLVKQLEETEKERDMWKSNRDYVYEELQQANEVIKKLHNHLGLNADSDYQLWKETENYCKEKSLIKKK